MIRIAFMAILSVLITMSGTNMYPSEKSTDRAYYQGAYPASHWALQTFSLEDDSVIALLKYKGSTYAVSLHPFDKRGYRSIVRLIDNHNMASTFNRPFTPVETLGLSIVTEMVTQSYERVMPIAQSFKLGNNSQSLDKSHKRVMFGSEREPSILHAHVMGRGDPAKHYMPDVPLDGPEVGKLFLFESYDKSDPGNDAQVPWKAGQQKAVSHALRDALYQVISDNKIADVSIIDDGLHARDKKQQHRSLHTRC